jgi:hypothetical protein
VTRLHVALEVINQYSSGLILGCSYGLYGMKNVTGISSKATIKTVIADRSTNAAFKAIKISVGMS